MKVNDRAEENAITLITKGCCFLCLKAERIQQIVEEGDKEKVKNSFSFRDLLRHIQITDQSLNGIASAGLLVKSGEIQAELCQSCGKTMARLSVLLHRLEKIQMETNYCLERISKSIQESKKHPDRLQNYSKKMTSDSEALSQLAFVDNLRKEIAEKTSNKWMSSRHPRVSLTRIKPKAIKIEVIKEENDNPDGLIEAENNETDEFQCDNAPSQTLSFQEFSPISPAPSSSESQAVSKRNFAFTTDQERNYIETEPQDPPTKIKSAVYYKKNPATGIFHCTKCVKKYEISSSALKHYKSVHLKIRFKCDFCNKNTFTQRTHLDKHKKTCPLAKFNRESASTESNAILSSPNTDMKLTGLKGMEGNEDNHPFSSDPKTSGLTSSLPQPPLLSSTKCGSHKPIIMGVHYKKTEGNQFNCTFCNKTFLSLMGTRFHIQTNHFGKRYKCHKCKDDFSLNDTLKKHLKWCKGVKRNRGTPTGFEFGKHVTKNYKTGNYNCTSCSKIFHNLKIARSHYTIEHLGRRFKCPKCNGEFKAPDHLKNCKGKVKVEPKSERKLTCDKCNAHYKSESGYNYHVKRCKSNQLKHARPRTVSALNSESGMYKCSLCPKEFGTREKCRYHYDKIHLKRKYKCDNCNIAIFIHQKSLWNHKKTCKERILKKRLNTMAVKTEEKCDDVAPLVEVKQEDPTT